jgi:hypothetical protein
LLLARMVFGELSFMSMTTDRIICTFLRFFDFVPYPVANLKFDFHLVSCCFRRFL